MARIFNDESVKNPADLVVKDALELVEEISKSEFELTKSQLRRFYQEIVHIRQGVPINDKDADEKYRKNEVKLKMLIPKVVYATGRKNAYINDPFAKWLRNNIMAINGPEDLHKFGDYFEAFVGYFYFEGQRQGGGGNRQQGKPNKWQGKGGGRK